MAEVKETVDTMKEAVEFYREHSRIHPTSGMREINRDAYLKRLKDEHDITKDQAKKFQDAVNFENEVVANVLLEDLEQKIGESADEDLKNDEFRRNLSVAARIPTFGGNTELELKAEKSSPIPGPAGEDGERKQSISYGRLRMTINTKNRISKDFHETAKDRVRHALGIKD